MRDFRMEIPDFNFVNFSETICSTAFQDKKHKAIFFGARRGTLKLIRQVVILQY